MDMVFWLVIGLGVGIYVGYKHPEQVTKALEQGKKTYNDFKDKFTKKEPPPSA
ncbi:MAG: hypothetical protein P8X65_10285 [Syntrophobacterales bacterium]|jgi:hypothetical protein